MTYCRNLPAQYGWWQILRLSVSRGLNTSLLQFSRTNRRTYSHTSPLDAASEEAKVEKATADKSEERPTLNGNKSHHDHGPNGTSEKDSKVAETASPRASTEEQLAAEVTTQPVEGTTQLEDMAEEPSQPTEPAGESDIPMLDALEGVVKEEPGPRQTVTPPATEPVEDKDMAVPYIPQPENASPPVASDANGEMVADGKGNSADSILATMTDAPIAAGSPQEVAIESTPLTTNADVDMTDAPAAAPLVPSKTPRDEDDNDDNDDDEEPLAKRQRTEPAEAEVQVSTTEDARGPDSLEKLEKWNDEELAIESITPYRVREYRRALGLVKKTKAGMAFKDAVAKLWPGLAEAYLARVEHPMDLGELERRLKDNQYKTIGDFKKDLALIYTNSVDFNGTTHDVTQQSFGVVENVWSKCMPISADEPPKSKQAKTQPTRHHEPRASTQSQAPQVQAEPTPQAKAAPAEKPAPPPKPKASQPARRMSSAAPSPTDKAVAEQAFALPPGGVPQIRRSSTQNEGDRPKRTIHPPKPKEIDYSSKSGPRKHQRPEMQFCAEVLRIMKEEKYYYLNAPFLNPVDPIALQIPNYFQIIKKPMDLGTIEAKLNQGEYATEKPFVADVELMFGNCFKFNQPEDGVYNLGKQLHSLFKAEWAKKDEWLAKHAPSKPASVASDAHSDDESDVGVEPAPPSEDMSLRQMRLAVDQLQQQLTDETNRLNGYIADELPNENLITAQNAILATLQKCLLEVKQKISVHTQKQAVAPKPTKTSKPKTKGGANAGGAAKKSGAAAGGRKSGGAAAAKKAPRKEPAELTEQQKQDVANGVGNLDSPWIEQAIAIIKKDTQQTVGPSIPSPFQSKVVFANSLTGK